ncbi:HNH endonuclease [Sutcliffiella horikoshii]|uniref:HNH endonuclease n=1 Tax=Sutcliffiella horikoshii TaxID=79883 RepID=A0A5D4SC08_9BACI|nr:HNH endonuclease signature motif containing protein [Sutcliffiella horikoshii]TYS60499.1 HNH endonuclease [Sutcliffiella horikoshii]
MGHRYTEEQREFIRSVAPGRYNVDIADLFNEKYGTNVTEKQINSFKKNHSIQSNLPRKRKSEQEKLFTEEQAAFIKQHVKGISNQKLADLVNETFNLTITKRQMNTWKKNNRLSSGLKGSEGMDPPNKGTKGVYNVGGNETSFVKGQKAHNYKPVGYERMDAEGYILIKVQDEGPWHKRWRHKHKVVWEKVHGPIPKGKCLLFLDGDKTNITVDNLLLITKSQLARMNQHHLITNDAELTKTGVVIADIYSKIGERKRGAKE